MGSPMGVQIPLPAPSTVIPTFARRFEFQYLEASSEALLASKVAKTILWSFSVMHPSAQTAEKLNEDESNCFHIDRIDGNCYHLCRVRQSATGGPMEDLDSLDLRIIDELHENARKPLIEIAQTLGVSHATIRNRLDRLLSKGVARLVAIVDPLKVGYPIQAVIGIKADLREMVGIERRLRELQEVYFVSTTTGRLDFLIGAVFSSDEHLTEFLSRKLARIDGIRDTETFRMLRLGKRVWEWKLPASSRPPSATKERR